MRLPGSFGRATSTSTGARLRRLGVARGIRGGSWTWAGVAAIAYGLRALIWALKPEAPVVLSESIAPGQTLVITHHPAKLSRAATKKAAKKAAKKAGKKRA